MAKRIKRSCEIVRIILFDALLQLICDLSFFLLSDEHYNLLIKILNMSSSSVTALEFINKKV